MKEVWRDVKGYEGLYKVSNKGNVISYVRKKPTILKLRENSSGYFVTTLSKNSRGKSFRVHRLVAEAFIENSHQKPFINHKDSNRKNNCVNNLEWCTQSENMIHSYKSGYSIEKKRPVEQYDMHGNFIKRWSMMVDAISQYKSYHICECCRGQRKTACNYTWRYAKEGDA